MQLLNLEQGSDAWFDFRKGKISGTHLAALYSKRGTRKLGFYETIAERLAIEPDDENRMERGLRLEDEAAQLFAQKYGKKPEVVGVCVSDENPAIINSPDRLIKNRGKYTEALEIKCLSPARHIQAVVENKVPDEYEAQKIQYFIVNPELQKLYFVFYDPRIQSVPFFVVEVTRKELGDLPEKYKQFQIEQLKEMDDIVTRLAF